MKKGDLVLQNNEIFIVMSVEKAGAFGYMAMVKSVATGNTSGFPPEWLTKIKTDNL